MRHVMAPIIALGAALIPISSYGADLRVPLYKASPTLVYNWTGCYIGGQLGGQWGHVRGDVNYPGDVVHPAVIVSRDFDGDAAFLYGGQIGCNWQGMGSSFVFGVEGDIAGLSGGRLHGEIYRFSLVTTDHFDAADRFSTQGSLRLRAGYAMDRMLLYIAGGWTRARISATEYFYRDGIGALTFDASTSRDGWNIGLGLEYALGRTMFGNNWTAGLEYRYTDYGSFSRSVPGGSVSTLTWVPFTASFDNLHTSDVRFRLNYVFNNGAIVTRY